MAEQISIDRLLLHLHEETRDMAALARELRVRRYLSEGRTRRRISARRVDPKNAIALGRPEDFVDGGSVASLVGDAASAIGPGTGLARSVADDHRHCRIALFRNELNWLLGKNVLVHVGSIEARQHGERAGRGHDDLLRSLTAQAAGDIRRRVAAESLDHALAGPALRVGRGLYLTT